MSGRVVSRRRLLQLMGAGVGGVLLAACQPQVVKETVLVEKEVEKLVKETVVTVVEKEVEVTPTPVPVVGTKKLTLKVTSFWASSEAAANNPNDVVTPYIEEMFNVQFDMIAQPKDMRLEQEYALLKAAGTLPEIMVESRIPISQMAATGDFADMTDYLGDMPNYTRYVFEPTWSRWATGGRHYILPINTPVFGLDPKYKGDIYNEGVYGHPLLVREDLLAKTGYRFTPLLDIAKETTEKGILPTPEQLAIEPAIDTPEKFDELLRKIKALDLRAGGKPLYPINTHYWSLFHFSSMMDNGHWRVNDEGEVDGYLGTPGAHPYYKLWWQWYRDGLVDPDYVIDKRDQLQEKWASGRAGIGMLLPNLPAAVQALTAVDPAAVIRTIPWPKEDQRYGYFDIFEGGYTGAVFSKELGDDLPRLVEMMDFFSSDEGQAIRAWGPPNVGLYVAGADGKRQWKDEETRKNIMDNVSGTKNADYYGLEVANAVTLNRVAHCIGRGSTVEADPRRNYPPQVDIFGKDVLARVFSTLGNNGMNIDGRMTYGDGGKPSQDAEAYYWDYFIGGTISKILQAENESQFEAGWAEIMDGSMNQGNYAQAKADMTKWFKEFGPEDIRDKITV